MEVDQPLEPSRKRANEEIVDPDDGTAISSAKKSRIQPEIPKKVKCLKFLIYFYDNLVAKLPKDADKPYRNINISIQLTNIIFSMFTISRQKANGISGASERKAKAKKSFSITSRGINHTIQFDDAETACKDAATKADLVFKRYQPNDPENWYGTAAPYLDFFTAHGLRITELRVGHKNMPLSKVGDKSTAFQVEKYGINGSHHVLLEGSTYPPEKRGSMAQSVGPLTALLCHIRTEDKYRKKWTDAAKRAMAHIPMIDEILDLVKGKRASEVRGLISLLADILLVVTARQANRMFFPLCALARVYKMKVDDNDVITSVGGLAGYLGGDTLLKGFNVSGNGGFYFYKIISHLEFVYEGNLTPVEAKQVFFHAIFGTYKEDLTILEQITDLGTWNTREQIGTSFQKMTTSGKYTRFVPVKMRKYSKLAAANQTGLLATSYLQVCSVPVFSGQRSQHFTDDFFEQIGKGAGMTSTAKTIPQITAALTTILSDLRQHLINNGKKLEIGTVQWRSMGDIDIVDGGSVLNETIEGRCKFFLGR